MPPLDPLDFLASAHRRHRRRLRRLAFGVGLLLLAVAIGARGAALDDLRAFASQTKTAKGSFTQRITSRSAMASQPSSGTFAFARPGRFRWTYEKPYEQLLVADGDRLSIYDKDLNQVTVRKLGDALGNTPAAILFGSEDLDRRFELRDTGVRDGLSWVEATPKSRDTQFERISIGFRDGTLAAMELRDALGQTTLLSFSNVERNAKLDPGLFTFVPAKGVDVVQD